MGFSPKLLRNFDCNQSNQINDSGRTFKTLKKESPTYS